MTTLQSFIQSISNGTAPQYIPKKEVIEEHDLLANGRTKHYLLVAPSGDMYDVINLSAFVREHPELFDAADVSWWRVVYEKHNHAVCKATIGLYGASQTKGKWKGWEIINVTAIE